ncbi:MAG TPA: hypothetical protein VNK23_07460 [Candidatus Dormibacteraeota bacterium]|nr:hypothetical protein [Candidatus Dormibacteraeota bacterium]
MSSGFNTDVRVGEQIFHVQTEDRGPSHPVIDTAVYQNGRVVHRRSSNYKEFSASTDFSTAGVRERVEEQHRAIIQELRSGALETSAPTAPNSPPLPEKPKAAAGGIGGIQVQLLNPQSWLSAGRVSLDLEIQRRADRQPWPGAAIEAAIEGSASSDRHTGTSDEQGRARIQFPLPPLGKGDLTLVILASADGDRDEVRFAMRSRDKSKPNGTASSA